MERRAADRWRRDLAYGLSRWRDREYTARDAHLPLTHTPTEALSYSGDPSTDGVFSDHHPTRGGNMRQPTFLLAALATLAVAACGDDVTTPGNTDDVIHRIERMVG
jgi:hypothetical protein